ncbi:MAG: ribonuclease P protein component [Candidatus Magasanikbacteria bacterium CG11_big_fil_rev_8_21_14_0_20_39_34]|uniref:Ribonuclease P protein component n=1 Tax=Candidatus Magasanikbacteria bacterium CG11_big_fil_rev_8_21_14_0_20_39_34 TaxID=1974653 RepID=A0A2H0N6N9_9BACT|nr:MAG: ribonuclease P protein component [Candidatus Magasanikbacteria bacterium CG11_big_fil_rev_8_21_14_0_20_39_34]
MLPKEFRLKHMKDFKILFDEGHFVGGKVVNMKIWPIQPEKYPRRNYTKDTLLIGFVVSTKVSKSAVKRNRGKRQMREVVRLLLKDHKLKKGFIITLMAKNEILHSEYAEIEKSILDILKRGRVLK